MISQLNVYVRTFFQFTYLQRGDFGLGHRLHVGLGTAVVGRDPRVAILWESAFAGTAEHLAKCQRRPRPSFLHRQTSPGGNDVGFPENLGGHFTLQESQNHVKIEQRHPFETEKLY